MTGQLFQPLGFGAGVREPVIAGAVLSMLTVVESAALFPALSVAVPLTGWFNPSVLTV